MNTKKLLYKIKRSCHKYTYTLEQLHELARGQYPRNDSDSSYNVGKMLRKHWSKEAVIREGKGIHEHEILKKRMLEGKPIDPHVREIPKGELMEGELSAVTFQVGCYTVRSSRRLYWIHGPGYTPELEIPADLGDFEGIRSAYDTEYDMLSPEFPYTDSMDMRVFLTAFHKGLRPVHEISVRHNLALDEQFTYVCRASRASNNSWSEKVTSICAAKENAAVPDEYASLFVCSRFLGSSWDSATWYKLAPFGSITSLSAGAYGIMADDAKFQ